MINLLKRIYYSLGKIPKDKVIKVKIYISEDDPEFDHIEKIIKSYMITMDSSLLRTEYYVTGTMTYYWYEGIIQCPAVRGCEIIW